MTRFLLLLCLSLGTLASFAQSKRKPAPFNSMKANDNDKFLNKQFWLGFKAGTNLTNPIVGNRYTVITPTNYPVTQTEKTYRSFDKAGAQATLEVTFYFKGISLSFQPTYRTSTFTYSNQYSWTNPEKAGERLDLKFDQQQRLDAVDLPLMLKYEFGAGKLRPFIQAGGYYSLVTNATKSVVISGTDQASGGTNTFENPAVILGAKDLFANNWGIVGGAGVYYNLGNVRIVFDASYKFGMSNVANVKTRYSNDRLSGIGDVQDDLKIQNLSFSVGCLFPLRFLSTSFKTLD